MDLMGYQILPTRYRGLQAAMEGYQRTGVPLVAYQDGKFAQTHASNDVGIYYFIPLIARLFHLSLDQAILVFFLGILGIALVLGILGCFLWLKHPVSRAFAVIAMLLLARSAFLAGDIYVIYATQIMTIVPFLMWFLRRERIGTWFFIYLFVACILVGIAHYMRAFSGLALLILMVGLIASANRLSWKMRALSIAVMAVGLLVPVIFFNEVVQRRDAWLIANQPGYQKSYTGLSFWHSAYLGLGYLPNDFGIEYKDIVAIDKARSIDPKAVWPSQEYNRVIRDEYFRIVRTAPWFVAETLLAKLGIVLLFLIKYTNIGLVAAFLRPRKPLAIELSFIAAMIVASLPGILVMPLTLYLMAFMSICVIYAIASVDWKLAPQRA